MRVSAPYYVCVLSAIPIASQFTSAVIPLWKESSHIPLGSRLPVSIIYIRSWHKSNMIGNLIRRYYNAFLQTKLPFVGIQTLGVSRPHIEQIGSFFLALHASGRLISGGAPLYHYFDVCPLPIFTLGFFFRLSNVH